MNIVESTCLELNNIISNKRSKESIYTMCVMDKLSSLYNTQSNDIDGLINSLIEEFDESNINKMCNTLKRLNRCLKGNREQLLCILERMCN